jgi:tRNA(Ile)-lysidine synthase
LPDRLGTLRFSMEQPKDSKGWLPLQLTKQHVTVCFGTMSARFKPAHAPQHKSLKRWCQLWQVPPWQRPRLPLIFQQDQLVAVAGYASTWHAEQATLWLSHQQANGASVMLPSQS